jgi:hypothetical protein
MSTAKEPPTPIGEIIDKIEQIREELFTLQKSLEKTESIECSGVSTDRIEAATRPASKALNSGVIRINER